MKKKHQSVDGIILKRSSNHQLGGLQFGDEKIFKSADIAESIAEDDIIESGLIGGSGIDENPFEHSQENTDLSRLDINESLNNLNKPQPAKKLGFWKRRKQAKQQKLNKKPKSKFRKILKRVIIFIVVVLLAFGIYTGVKLFLASNNMFSGNIFQAFKAEPLQQDSNGRSNFLILGTSEDDPGHDAPNLTDSILVLSIDQKNYNAYVFSVPRDLYVEYGQACSAGYSGKINSYFYCANDGETDADEQDRLTKTQELVGNIFGLDIQYGVHVNYTVVKQAVDAVGGIDVDIQGSNGAEGVMDRHFDDQCNYTCYLVKYDNGVHHLDGQQALNLARVRGDSSPTYGLSRSNFDREINQQKIMIALKNKAVSGGTLTNFSKVSKLIDALGNNLRTNIQTKEIRTLIDVASKAKSSDVHMLAFIGDDSHYMTTGSYGDAGSVVMPSLGIYDYSDIQKFLKQSLSSNPIEREAAPIVVLNGSGTEGLGRTKADALTAGGYNISIVDNAPEGTYEPVEVYQIGEGNSGTAAKLTKLYNVTIKTTDPPIAINDDIRFVIIFGPAASATTTQ